jgi:hypothetical protein
MYGEVDSEDDDNDEDEDDEETSSDRDSSRTSMSDRESILSQKFLKRLSAVFPTKSPTIEELHRGKAFSFSRFIEKATGSSRHDDVRRRRANTFAGGSVHGEEDGDEVDSITERELVVSPERRGHLLKSHYFHSEIQFVMALVDISKRLCSVPKAARQSSLQAELTLLNHNLPADVCIPLWCHATAEHPYHHQVVRIALQDSVVLNSAEKVSVIDNVYICVYLILG